MCGVILSQVLGVTYFLYITVCSTPESQTSDSTENVSGQFLQGARHDPLVLCNKPYYTNKNGVHGDSFIIIIYNITAA